MTGAGCRIEAVSDADVPIVDRDSQTALQLASKRRFTDIMSLLEMAQHQNSGGSRQAEIFVK
jgi:hypothetical protein